ncbi:MAG TPA: hypothetical protein VLM87_11025 [Rubrivivax sp.]|nr:hypothetical protein [Rubrivivax sp.]
MSRLHFFWRVSGAVVAALSVLGCTSTVEMSAKQREGVELRRYCEQNPQDDVKCLGFLGFR